MKIVIVSIYPEKNAKHSNKGGVASYTKNLVSNIPLDQDDEIYVICDKINNKNEHYQEDGATILRVFNRNTFFAYDIAKQVSKIKPDVLHIQQEVSLYGGVHTAYILQWLVLILRAYNPIVTLHHVVDRSKINKQFVAENRSKLPVPIIDAAFLAIYQPLVRLARHSIVHESHFKNLLVSQYGAKHKNISIICHGVEDPNPIPTSVARKALKLKPTDHVALFMGYLAGYKGIDLLLEGFGEYASQDPHAVLLIGAGIHPKFAKDPSYMADYEQKQQKAAKLIPSNQYRWLGFIEEKDIKNYYSASDVVLFPYTISMSSSGPMSLAIGYQKAFLGSTAFADILPADVQFAPSSHAMANKLLEFFDDPTPFTRVSADMKQERLWANVGAATKAIYKKGIKE